MGVGVAVICTGCGVKYDYSNVDTTPYSKGYSLELPDPAEQELTIENIYTLPYIEVADKLVIISNPVFTNYAIRGLSNYIFVFETDAQATITDNFHTTYCTAFIGLADNLYIRLNGSISTGIDEHDLAGELLTDCSIVANNLFILGSGTIYSSVNCLQANTIAFAGDKIVNLTATQNAIDATIVNICSGELTINALTGITGNQTKFLGGTVNFLCKNVAMSCSDTTIFNGLINIESETAITCNNFVKNGGYLAIKSANGIMCQNAEIGNGYLYANCKIVGIKAIYALSINNGVAIIVATQNNQTAIDAETANFNIYGGTIITHSTYACAPSNNALFFGIDNTQFLVLQNAGQQLVYIPQISGSVMVASTTKYSYYSTSGKITGFNTNYFGLLMDAKVNTYSNTAIDYNQPNNNAIIYNGEPAQNGQLF